MVYGPLHIEDLTTDSPSDSNHLVLEDLEVLYITLGLPMKSMNCLVAGLVVHMRQVSSQAEETLQTLRQNGNGMRLCETQITYHHI